MNYGRQYSPWAAKQNKPWLVWAERITIRSCPPHPRSRRLPSNSRRLRCFAADSGTCSCFCPRARRLADAVIAKKNPRGRFPDVTERGLSEIQTQRPAHRTALLSPTNVITRSCTSHRVSGVPPPSILPQTGWCQSPIFGIQSTINRAPLASPANAGYNDGSCSPAPRPLYKLPFTPPCSKTPAFAPSPNGRIATGISARRLSSTR